MSEEFFTNYLILVPLALLIYYLYCFELKFNHWKNKGVKYAKSIPFFGSVASVTLLRENVSEKLKKIYNDFPRERFVGFYQSNTPVLLIRDPELAKQILVKDFQHFPNRDNFRRIKYDPLSDNLFYMDVAKWKELRHELAPAFTSAKLKTMLSTLTEFSYEFNQYVKKIVAHDLQIDIQDLCSNLTTQVIGSCIFGINVDAINNSKSKFREMIDKVFQRSFYHLIQRSIGTMSPWLFAKLHMRSMDPEVEQFFVSVVKDLVKYRKQNDIQRGDFLQILIDLRGQIKPDLTSGSKLSSIMDDNLLAAQMFIFFAAGFETTSSAMSFCLYELALNVHIQNRLQKEIDRTLCENDGKLSYDAIMEIEYLDQVLAETLRKYPPSGSLIRKCESKYTLPETDVILEKDDLIVIPVYALHHDPKYYPKPEKFDPDRFTRENKESRKQFSYMPFGEGPRMCIGK